MYESAERLDRALRDPTDPHNPFGYRAAVARDQRGTFPDALCAVARGAELHTSYLPRELGGTLDSFDEALTLVRTVARRDVAVMPAAMIGITAAYAVLVGGSPEQRRTVADLVRGGATIAFALTERDSGSDVLSGTCRLEPAHTGDPEGAGYLLTGDKWMVGMGVRCDALLVVARTGERGPGAFTAVLLDRSAPPAGAVEVSEPVPTTGMRGIDFAHYGFDRCPVPADAVVGPVGSGLDTALRAQQAVRAMSAAGNLACADTGLRVTLDFATEHTVGRSRLVDVQPARRELALAAAALLATDVMALTAARALHVAPERFVLPASVVKRVATEESDALLARCAGVLGARSVIADGPTGVVQKLVRDNAVVRYFDTGPVGTLRTVAAQLPLLARAGSSTDAEARETDLAAVFDLRRPLPPVRPTDLDLTTRGHDDVVAGLPTIAAQARKELAELGGNRADELVAALEDELAALLERAAGAAGPELLDLAERFCPLYAAAAAVHLWWFNRADELFGEPPAATGWLTGCLAYLLARAAGPDVRAAADEAQGALDVVAHLHRQNRLFSAVPLRLCGRGEPDQGGRRVTS